MKTNRLFITAAIIIAGSFIVNISAQDALKAIAKKCETMENVDISVVRNRNRETKKMERTIISINFQNNESLKKEILAAFEKDRSNADQDIEDRKSGRGRELMLRFGSSSYSYSERNDGRFSFSVIEDNDSKDGAFFHNGVYFNYAHPFQAQAEIATQTINSLDWEEFSDNLKGLEDLDHNFENFEIDMKGFEIDMKNFEKEAKNFEKEMKYFEKQAKNQEIGKKNVEGEVESLEIEEEN